MAANAFEPHRFGAYALEARLGHGGMAEVFRASREGVAGFARQCVVKRILGHHNEDPSFVDMFINEAKIAAELTHPNIVQVYELGQVDGEFFIAMEYVKGKDLLRVLRELAQKRQGSPAIPPGIAAYVARETCRALQHAHDHTDARGQLRPIIHRDVSPQNVMISFDGQVKLVDFGIAKALGSMRDETRTGALKGKFAYMAPEQIAGQNPGPSADVFSTGVVLHEMLTGRRLFKGQTDYDTLTKVRTMKVPRPSSIDGNIPAELDAIAMKSLERDRANRYERAAQMARDLDEFLASVRFSVEDLADFMRELFPPEPAEPVPAEHITKEYVLKPSRQGGSLASLSSLPGDRPGSLAAQPLGERVEPTPTPVTGSNVLAHGSSRIELTPTSSGGRRTLLLTGGLALFVGAGAIFLVARKTPPDVQAVDAVAAHGAKVETLQLAPETRTVHLRTEPIGARVFEGPRLVGETPLELRLNVDSPGMTLTFVHDGRADLTYQVKPADAPELTLRMQQLQVEVAPPPTQSQHHVHSGAPKPPTVKPAISTKPNSTKPNDEPTPQRPKVQTFDD